MNDVRPRPPSFTQMAPLAAVVGAGGFIGKGAVSALLDVGFDVRATVRDLGGALAVELARLGDRVEVRFTRRHQNRTLFLPALIARVDFFFFLDTDHEGRRYRCGLPRPSSCWLRCCGELCRHIPLVGARYISVQKRQ